MTRLNLVWPGLQKISPATIKGLETKLLNGSASPVEMRVRSHTALLNAIDLEIEALKSKFNPNPPH